MQRKWTVASLLLASSAIAWSQAPAPSDSETTSGERGRVRNEARRAGSNENEKKDNQNQQRERARDREARLKEEATKKAEEAKAAPAEASPAKTTEETSAAAAQKAFRAQGNPNAIQEGRPRVPNKIEQVRPQFRERPTVELTTETARQMLREAAEKNNKNGNKNNARNEAKNGAPNSEATPFVPTDMPDNLKNQGNKKEGRPENPNEKPNGRPGEKPKGEEKPGLPTPAPSPTPEPSPTPAPSPSPSPAPSPTPEPSPVPVDESKPDAPKPDVPKPDIKPVVTPKQESVKVEDAKPETFNQAAAEIFGKRDEQRKGRPNRRDPEAPKLTPWVEPSEKIAPVFNRPPSATPTPTPPPNRILIDRKNRDDFRERIKKIGLVPTPPPAPTPGITPVPTPPGVAPMPKDWRPSNSNWKPYPGWKPVDNWKPPTGWVPPGGWNPPPGWEPPREWIPRLNRWGWQHIPNRGWVVDVRWTPPSDFVVPPGWYYMPSYAYEDYGFHDPSQVVIVPGKARPDLVVNVNINNVYTPPPPPPVIVQQPPPPPRPLPQEPVFEQTKTVQVEQVVKVFSRPREPKAPRYAGPVLVTGAVHFDTASYAIKPDSFQTLDNIGVVLSDKLPEAIINIEGHTDATGSDELNQTLSEQRAWSVKSYLVQKFGIDPNRLIIVGYGKRAPIADNVTPEGKARNRRVEFENVTDLYKAQVIEETNY